MDYLVKIQPAQIPLNRQYWTGVNTLGLLRKEGYKVETIAVTLPKKYESKSGYKPVPISKIAEEIAIGCFKIGKVKNS